MSNISPVFPIVNPQPFSDYGFDLHPQVDYFQVMEEARKHKRETSKKSFINSLHFKIQKPISKDDPTRITIHNNKMKKKRWWWKKAFPFLKWRKWPISAVDSNDEDHRKVRNFRALSMSGPVYSTESRTGSTTPYRTTTRKGDVSIPYLSLRELNVDPQQRIPTSSLPIYLVT